jgi:hypothetical protein
MKMLNNLTTQIRVTMPHRCLHLTGESVEAPLNTNKFTTSLRHLPLLPAAVRPVKDAQCNLNLE